MDSSLNALHLRVLGRCNDGALVKTGLRALCEASGIGEEKELQKSLSDGGESDSEDEDADDSFVGRTVQASSSTTGASQLYAWGRASNYQLGFGSVGNEQPVPKPVSFPAGVEIRSLSCGQFHTLAISSHGDVFVWGFNGNTGRLGIVSSDKAQRPPTFVVEPQRVEMFGVKHRAVKAAAGGQHSLVLTDSGKLFVWGANTEGQLGVQGPPSARPQVLKHARLGVVLDIAAGEMHSLAASGTNHLFSWGSNTLGALGLGAPPAGCKEASTPQQLPHLEGIIKVYATRHVSAALTQSGEAIFWGSPNIAPACEEQRHFLPSRVRRKWSEASSRALPNLGPPSADGRTRAGSSTGMTQQQQQQQQQQRAAWKTNSRQGASAAGPAIVDIALGSEFGFAVDVNQLLWAWPLSDRPAQAEVVSVQLKRLPSLKEVPKFAPAEEEQFPKEASESSSSADDDADADDGDRAANGEGTTTATDPDDSETGNEVNETNDANAEAGTEGLTVARSSGKRKEQQKKVASSPASKPALPPPSAASDSLIPFPTHFVATLLANGPIAPNANASTAMSRAVAWVVDGTPEKRLWSLQRLHRNDIDADGSPWRLKCCDQIAQVVSVTSSGDHQAVLTHHATAPPLPKEFEEEEEEETEGAEDEEVTRGASATPNEDFPFEDNAPPSFAFASASFLDLPGFPMDAPKRRTGPQPDSLQRICERRLCATLNPRSFLLVATVAWELNLPMLLDAAYIFLQRNAALLFTRLHLPALLQLDVTVIAAFRLTALGKFSKPSSAVEAICGGDCSANDGLQDMTAEELEEEVGNEVAKTASGKHRSGTQKGTPQLQPRQPPQHQQQQQRQQQTSKAARQSPQGIVPQPPPQQQRQQQQQQQQHPQQQQQQQLQQQPKNQKHTKSPGLGSSSPPLGVTPATSSRKPSGEEWVEVGMPRRRGRTDSDLVAKSPIVGPISAAAATSTTSNAAGAAPAAAVDSNSLGPGATAAPAGEAGDTPGTPLLEIPSRPLLLSDFLLPRAMRKGSGRRGWGPAVAPEVPAKAASGSSATPAGAKPPTPTSTQTEAPTGAEVSGQPPDHSGPSDILKAASGQAAAKAKSKASPWVRTDEAPDASVDFRSILKEEGAQAKNATTSGPEMTTCSWGFDAMPSQKPKQANVYDIQRQEQESIQLSREADEIREIEAMFAALAIAEQEEEREFLGLPKPEDDFPNKATEGKAKSKTARDGKERKEKSSGKGGNANADGRKKGSRHKDKDSSSSTWWQSWSWSDWKTGGGGGGGGEGGVDEESWKWSTSTSWGASQGEKTNNEEDGACQDGKTDVGEKWQQGDQKSKADRPPKGDGLGGRSTGGGGRGRKGQQQQQQQQQAEGRRGERNLQAPQMTDDRVEQQSAWHTSCADNNPADS